MAAGATVWLGIVLAAAGMLATGGLWLDPLAAILVSLVIALSNGPFRARSRHRHMTLPGESGDGDRCRLAPAHRI